MALGDARAGALDWLAFATGPSSLVIYGVPETWVSLAAEVLTGLDVLGVSEATCSVVVSGTTATVSLSGVQVAGLGDGVRWWQLTSNGVPVLAGRWMAVPFPTAAWQMSTVQVSGGVHITVSGASGGAGGGGGGGGSTNLGYIASPTQGVVTSDTGTDATLTLASGTNAGLMAPAQHASLAGIVALGSLATDAELATEASTRAAADTALDGRLDVIEAVSIATDAELAAAVAAHEADTTSVHGIADTSALVTTSTAPELIRDTMATALVAGTNVTITPNDGADTITIAASGGGGGVTVPTGSTAGGSYCAGLPGVTPIGVSGAAGALSQYDIYTFPIVVTSPIVVIGWDAFVNSGNSAGTVLRASIFAGSAVDWWSVGALFSDLGSASTAASGGKSVTGLSVSLPAGVYQVAVVTDAPALALYGPSVSVPGARLIASAGNQLMNFQVRWWYDYTSSPNYAAVGMPASLAGNNDNAGALSVVGGPAKAPISLRWTA